MVTPIYAALLALLLIFLSIYVIKGRQKFSAGLGDAGNVDMRRRIRAQANLAEYSPIFLIMLGYSEIGGLAHWALHVLGIAFVLGRLMHAYSLLKHEQYDGQKLLVKPTWRIRAMASTFTILGLLAIILFTQSILSPLLLNLV